MSDIVEQARTMHALAGNVCDPAYNRILLQMADRILLQMADELERLQADNEQMDIALGQIMELKPEDMYHGSENSTAAAIARGALEEKNAEIGRLRSVPRKTDQGEIQMAALAALMHMKPDYRSPKQLEECAATIARLVESALKEKE